MNRTAVFSKTGKGLLEIKNKANRLSKDQYRVLNLVDGKANLVDLADRAKVSEIEVRKILGSLSDSGYIKEFMNPSGDFAGSTVPPSTSYADDLDFTAILGPAQSAKPGFYQSAALEQRKREEAERRASEAAATRAREESERRAKEEAENRARAEAAARKVREEAERRAREEFERTERTSDELRNRAENERKAKEEAERKAREAQEAMLRKVQQEKLEAERRAKEEAERRVQIQAEARARVEAEKRAREEAERKAREDEERRKREEEERRKREEEERRKREEEERRKREEEERRKREEEERRKREEEERRRREEEERRRREEEERRRKEEEERKRKEEEERKRKEEEERRRREEEERRRNEEEEKRRREEEARRRQEEEERRRQEEERRRKEEEEERKRKEEAARKLQDDQERLKRELEEKQRREQEELIERMEEERRRLEDDDYRRRAEEEDRRRQEQEQRQREEEERANEAARRREEDERRRQEEEQRRREAEEKRRQDDQERRSQDEEKRRREQEERNRKSAAASEPARDAFPSLDITAVPVVSNAFDTDLDALKRAEAQVEREFQDKEDAIRKALEEQERRFRMEEEARAAMDRAERDARERADREARELALAAEQARREAEQRAREEGVRRAQEEKERRAKEQDERRKLAEENSKKRERERREAEQRSREEELTRRRKEQEEQDRRKAEIDRLQGEARRRAFGPGKIAAAALVVLAVLTVAAVEVAPMSAYAPNIEKLASEALGEPVRVGDVHASLFPSFHVELNKVTVGNAQDVTVGKAVVYMGLGSAFGDDKDVSKLVLDSVNAPQEALGRLPRWIATEGKPGRIALERVQFKGVKLSARGVELPSFDADILLASDRSVRGVTIETNDGRLTAELTPREQGVDVVARGRGFVLPVGPPMELTDFTAKGVARGNELKVSELEYSLYGGQGKGTLNVSWGAVWSVDGSFDVQRVELEPAMKAINADIPSDGTLEAKGRFALQSVALGSLLDAPRIDAAFMVRKGNLSGLDLVRALQSPSRDGTAGGKTKFEEMSGSISTSGGRIQFNGVKLAAGALTASGQGEVSESKDVNGRTNVELRSSANTIRGTFRVQGTLKGLVLRP